MSIFTLMIQQIFKELEKVIFYEVFVFHGAMLRLKSTPSTFPKST